MNLNPPFFTRPSGCIVFGGEREELAVDKIVARLNIKHYRQLLATETDETRRRMIMRLLAEEEAKLTALENKSKK